MSNLYHRVAVASVSIALGFVLGAKEKAYSATFSNFTYPYTHLTFHVLDGGSYGSFDGLGDTVTNVGYWNNPEMRHNSSWDLVQRTAVSEKAALLEYSLPFIAKVSNGYHNYQEKARITSITHAVLSIEVEHIESLSEPFNNSPVLGIFGYVGNGIAEASDLEAGVFLDSTTAGVGQWDYVNFNVTPFFSEIVSNNNEWAGFAMRSLNQNFFLLNDRWGRPPVLTISGEVEIVEPEPVPEPTTIFGSAIGLCLGGWLKRKKSSPQNKTTSQN
jgi:hypothetical protein